MHRLVISGILNGIVLVLCIIIANGFFMIPIKVINGYVLCVVISSIIFKLNKYVADGIVGVYRFNVASA